MSEKGADRWLPLVFKSEDMNRIALVLADDNVHLACAAITVEVARQHHNAHSTRPSWRDMRTYLQVSSGAA